MALFLYLSYFVDIHTKASLHDLLGHELRHHQYAFSNLIVFFSCGKGRKKMLRCSNKLKKIRLKRADHLEAGHSVDCGRTIKDIIQLVVGLSLKHDNFIIVGEA